MWAEGDVVLRREVLNDGRPWVETTVVVVRDEPGLLATYLAEGTPFTFPPGESRRRTADIRGTAATAGRGTAC